MKTCNTCQGWENGRCRTLTVTKDSICTADGSYNFHPTIFNPSEFGCTLWEERLHVSTGSFKSLTADKNKWQCHIYTGHDYPVFTIIDRNQLLDILSGSTVLKIHYKFEHGDKIAVKIEDGDDIPF